MVRWKVYITCLVLSGFLCLARGLAAVEPAALEWVGIRQLQQEYPFLDGYGVTIAAVCRAASYLNGIPQDDWRFNMTHRSLADADVRFEDGSDGRSGISAHATAIGGVLLGLDQFAHPVSGKGVSYQGVCPSVAVDVYEFWRFAALRLFAQKPVTADIVTLSLGQPYECWWTRAVQRLVDKENLIVVAAIGNGYAVRDGLLYPAAGANVIAAGVMPSALLPDGTFSLNQFTEPQPDFSSAGPTDDMRSKPDIVLPASALIPAANTPDGYEPVYNASSLAAPITAGTVALLLQYARHHPDLNGQIADLNAGCLFKAIVLTSAKKLPGWQKAIAVKPERIVLALDARQGAGMLDAPAALKVLSAGRYGEGALGQAGFAGGAFSLDKRSWQGTIAQPPHGVLTATLTWNRHFQDRYPFLADHPQTQWALELWATNADGQTERLDTSDSIFENVQHLHTVLPEGLAAVSLVVRPSRRFVPAEPFNEPFALAWRIIPPKPQD